MACAVCVGSGRYPIITATGKELYTIPCPECAGSGMTEDKADAALDAARDQRRYEAAMAETRARRLAP